jgi:hypothetical protein
MLILAGGILVSMLVLAFAGFILTVSANWIFEPKDGRRYHTSNRTYVVRTGRKD